MLVAKTMTPKHTGACRVHLQGHFDLFLGRASRRFLRDGSYVKYIVAREGSIGWPSEIVDQGDEVWAALARSARSRGQRSALSVTPSQRGGSRRCSFRPGRAAFSFSGSQAQRNGM